jgi:hypothetical protein
MKTISLFSLATFAALAISGHPAFAEQSRYTCKAGALTITSTTPCYVTSYGISVPGSDGIDKVGTKDSDPVGKNGGGIDGPKDLENKPKGSGFKGLQDIQHKD